MGEIIKSGLIVEGVEITSEHIGKKVEVVETDTMYLPVGFIAKIGEVSVGYVDFEDKDGVGSFYTTESDDTHLKFKWVNNPAIKPKQSSTKPARQKLAKSIKQSVADIQKLIDEAESYGMIVEGVSLGDVKVKFQPPMEEY